MLLSLLVLIIYAFRGPRPFAQIGISLGATIGLYFVGGVIAGLLLGLLFPFTIWRSGAVVVGMVVASPLYLGAAVVLGLPDLAAGVVASVVVGGVAGYSLWSPPKYEPSNRPANDENLPKG